MDIASYFLTLYDTHLSTVRPPTQLKNGQGVTQTALINDNVHFKKIYKEPFRPQILS